MYSVRRLEGGFLGRPMGRFEVVMGDQYHVGACAHNVGTEKNSRHALAHAHAFMVSVAE